MSCFAVELRCIYKVVREVYVIEESICLYGTSVSCKNTVFLSKPVVFKCREREEKEKKKPTKISSGLHIEVKNKTKKEGGGYQS